MILRMFAVKLRKLHAKTNRYYNQLLKMSPRASDLKSVGISAARLAEGKKVSKRRRKSLLDPGGREHFPITV
jgi:hypothetical protein